MGKVLLLKVQNKSSSCPGSGFVPLWARLGSSWPQFPRSVRWEIIIVTVLLSTEGPETGGWAESALVLVENRGGAADRTPEICMGGNDGVAWGGRDESGEETGTPPHSRCPVVFLEARCTWQEHLTQPAWRWPLTWEGSGEPGLLYVPEPGPWLPRNAGNSLQGQLRGQRFRRDMTLGDGGGKNHVQLPQAKFDGQIPTKSIERQGWEHLGRLLGGGDLCTGHGWDPQSDRERGWHEGHGVRAVGDPSHFSFGIHLAVSMMVKSNHGPSDFLTFGS